MHWLNRLESFKPSNQPSTWKSVQQHPWQQHEKFPAPLLPPRTRVVRLIANGPSPTIVAEKLVCQLEGVPASPTLHEVVMVRKELTGVAGFEPPWRWSVNRKILSQGGCEDGKTRLHPECNELSAKWIFPQDERVVTRSGVVPSRSWRRSGSVHMPNVSPHKVGTSSFQGAPDRAQLPVWPLL